MITAEFRRPGLAIGLFRIPVVRLNSIAKSAIFQKVSLLPNAGNPCPVAPTARRPRKPSPDDAGASSESRIFQPTASREAALGHSTGGKPGHRGGWKKR